MTQREGEGGGRESERMTQRQDETERQRQRERVLLLSDKRISNTSKVLITLTYAFLQIIKSKQTNKTKQKTQKLLN